MGQQFREPGCTEARGPGQRQPITNVLCVYCPFPFFNFKFKVTGPCPSYGFLTTSLT